MCDSPRAGGQCAGTIDGYESLRRSCEHVRFWNTCFSRLQNLTSESQQYLIPAFLPFSHFSRRSKIAIKILLILASLLYNKHVYLTVIANLSTEKGIRIWGATSMIRWKKKLGQLKSIHDFSWLFDFSTSQHHLFILIHEYQMKN